MAKISACIVSYCDYEEVCAAVPEVKQVVLIQEVSRDLLDQARAILNHSRENGHG